MSKEARKERWSTFPIQISVLLRKFWLKNWVLYLRQQLDEITLYPRRGIDERHRDENIGIDCGTRNKFATFCAAKHEGWAYAALGKMQFACKDFQYTVCGDFDQPSGGVIEAKCNCKAEQGWCWKHVAADTLIVAANQSNKFMFACRRSFWNSRRISQSNQVIQNLTFKLVLQEIGSCFQRQSSV